MFTATTLPSCNPFKVVEPEILALEKSLSEAVGQVLVNETIARNDLFVLNRGREFTFRRWTNLTISTPMKTDSESLLRKPGSLMSLVG